MARRTRLPLGLRTVARDEELTVVEHLEELRRRLIVSVLALVAAFAVTFIFRDWIIEILKQPLPSDWEGDGLLTLSPTEPFFTILKVCLWTAVLLALPVWLYQLYAFVIPAVGNQSRRLMLVVVAGVSALFLAGVAFGYYVVMPIALTFFLGFGGDLFTAQIRAGEYFGFVTTMLLASGMIFEVPVAMLALARLGVVTAEMYRTQWRIAIVVIAAVAALLPGGDPLSMMLLMAPMLVLYVVGIWLAKTFAGTPLWDRETWQAEPGDGGPASTVDRPGG
ncbi:MAG: twin-arginine translocase subunit TatC [Actinobacteria bacterium]|nr:twin-arginine translocase subunit TatC [Actinomycetota bacterium]